MKPKRIVPDPLPGLDHEFQVLPRPEEVDGGIAEGDEGPFVAAVAGRELDVVPLELLDVDLDVDLGRVLGIGLDVGVLLQVDEPELLDPEDAVLEVGQAEAVPLPDASSPGG